MSKKNNVREGELTVTFQAFAKTQGEMDNFIPEIMELDELIETDRRSHDVKEAQDETTVDQKMEYIK